MSIASFKELGTRISHPIGGEGTIVCWDTYMKPDFSPDWYLILFDKTKNKKPWLVRRFELTEII